MLRETRILEHNKADAMKIVSRKPSDTEGIEGDISIGSTANGVSLFAKIGNKWYEFSSNESIEKSNLRVKGSVSYVYGGYTDDGHSNFLPMNGSWVERTSIDETYQGQNTMLLPYDCRVLSITVRSDVALGSTYFYLWHSSDGNNIDSSDTSTRGELSDTINCSAANTAYTFQFSGAYEIPAKSNLAVQINPNGGSNLGDHVLNFIITLDYDIPV